MMSNNTLISVRSGVRMMARAGTAITIGLSAACSVSNLIDVGTPVNVVGQDAIDNYEGAKALYFGAMAKFNYVFGGGANTPDSFIAVTGLFSDELHALNTNSAVLDGRGPADASGTPGTPYGALQQTRVNTAQAIEVLSRFPAQAPKAYFAELYAAQAYTEIMLAELYCSGIPLTIVPFGGTIQYVAGSTTTEVLNTAIAHFDTALTYTVDNPTILTMIRVGKARALVNLGRYADAATAVAAVATTDTYTVQYSNRIGFQNAIFLGSSWGDVQEREGLNGINWISANDPRVPINGTNMQTKYATASTPITLADGIEARLIEAEADLQGTGAQWLSILNTLRTNGTYTTAVRTDPETGDSVGVDTTWNPGTAGVVGLRPLQDPGDPALRVNLLFRERAFWLYLTGHRHGDLRRLVRQYQRAANSVFPTGAYTPASQFMSVYGNAVVGEIREERSNPVYKGCFNLNA